ncbi:MAG: hypothetical protein HY558_00365 [Euryarchaeota archaeon]|nr:hypothetical protein [Euryarchaeota archaeon]
MTGDKAKSAAGEPGPSAEKAEGLYLPPYWRPPESPPESPGQVPLDTPLPSPHSVDVPPPPTRHRIRIFYEQGRVEEIEIRATPAEMGRLLDLCLGFNNAYHELKNGIYLFETYLDGGHPALEQENPEAFLIGLQERLDTARRLAEELQDYLERVESLGERLSVLRAKFQERRSPGGAVSSKGMRPSPKSSS